MLLEHLSSLEITRLLYIQTASGFFFSQKLQHWLLPRIDKMSDCHCLSSKPGSSNLPGQTLAPALYGLSIQANINTLGLVKLEQQRQENYMLQAFCPKKFNCCYHCYKPYLVSRMQVCIIWAAFGVISWAQKLVNTWYSCGSLSLACLR